MNDSFIRIVEKSTDKKLKKIIMNPQNYQEAFIEIAKNEFEKRHLNLNENETKKLKERKKELLNADTDNEKFAVFCQSYKENVIKDTSAPELYSRKLITVFAILFTSFFGGLLFSYNLLILKKFKEIIYVMFVSIVFTTITIGVGFATIGTRTIDAKALGYLTFFYLFGSKFFIDTIWWNFIGIKIQFRLKSLSIPLFLAITISTSLIYFFVIK